MDEESAGQKNQNWHYYEAKGLVEIWAKFSSKMMKENFSANLYQEYLILCSKILLNVLHNLS